MSGAHCPVCQRDPDLVNNPVRECSHVDCPNRRVAWSERPTAAELYRGPWPKRDAQDPEPLQGALTFLEAQ